MAADDVTNFGPSPAPTGLSRMIAAPPIAA
jgi:hypothetical protein